LTPFSVGALSETETGLNPAFEQRDNLLGIYAAWDCSSEIFNASRHALELRHPYRDRRLVEFVLSLPAYQLYYRGLYKYILRMAMQDILPDTIRTRYQPTSLLSLFLRGIERKKRFLEASIQDPDASWRKFVRADWLLKRWNFPDTPDKDGPQVLVPWLCISYEAWYKSFVSST
jgi:asparagine synthetase B (glutamine-hydrolysing)